MKVTSDVENKIRANPHVTLALIVRVRGDLDANATRMTQMGFTIRRQLRLIDALAVSGTGAQVEALVKEEWVISVEEDKPVKTS